MEGPHLSIRVVYPGAHGCLFLQELSFDYDCDYDYDYDHYYGYGYGFGTRPAKMFCIALGLVEEVAGA